MCAHVLLSNMTDIGTTQNGTRTSGCFFYVHCAPKKNGHCFCSILSSLKNMGGIRVYVCACVHVCVCVCVHACDICTCVCACV